MCRYAARGAARTAETCPELYDNERTERILSASREKKSRQDETVQGPSAREQKRRKEQQEAHRSNVRYAVVGAVCVALAALVLAWNGGLFHRTIPAASVDGVNYSAADVEYYYNSARSGTVNMYMSYFGSAPFDLNTSTKSQVFNQETGETWFDQLMTQAKQTMTENTTLAEQAKAEGYTLSEDGQETIDSVLESLETNWKDGGYRSRNAFLHANYGPYLSYNRFVELLTQDVLAEDYANSKRDAFTYSDSDYETYYQENKDTLDSFTVTQFLVQAQVETTDSEGKQIEMTDEEKSAALEEAKTEAKSLAETLKLQLENDAYPEALVLQYNDQITSYFISRKMNGSSLPSAYSEWVTDARQNGDVTLQEYDPATGTSYNYYVVRFEGRERDETPAHDVRHVLVAAETDEGASEPTEAQYEAAKTKAQELLDQWKSGEATEDSFSALAEENSADTGSAANGGLIANVTAESGYVDTFTDWTLDPARKSGDTGLVQNTGSSTKGWHIMYYVGPKDPMWKQSADSALRSQDYSDWREKALEGHEAADAFGARFVTG